MEEFDEQALINQINKELGFDLSSPVKKPVDQAEKEHVEALREELSILVACGRSKEALGKQLTQENVSSLSESEIFIYTKRYQAFIGAKTADKLVDSMICLCTRILENYFYINDIDSYKKELRDDYLLNRDLVNIAGSFILKCGKYIGIANLALITAKHINGTKSELLKEYVSYFPSVSLHENETDNTEKNKDL